MLTRRSFLLLLAIAPLTYSACSAHRKPSDMSDEAYEAANSAIALVDDYFSGKLTNDELYESLHDLSSSCPNTGPKDSHVAYLISNLAFSAIDMSSVYNDSNSQQDNALKEKRNELADYIKG